MSVILLLGLTAAFTTWEEWEMELSALRVPENPYRDVTLRATFQHTTGRTFTSFGFWDGGTVFRVRSFFPLAGNWTVTTTATPALPGLETQVTADILPPLHGQHNPLLRHGALQVSDNKRFLEHTDGTPFYWQGDTVWAGPLHATTSDWQAYVDDRVAKRFSVLQVGIASFWAGTVDSQGEAPFLAANMSVWNPAFFISFEEKIRTANRAGLVVLVVGIMEPSYRYPKIPEAVRFAQMLSGRLHGLHVILSASFDSPYMALGDAVGSALKDATSLQLITQHEGTGLKYDLDYYHKSYVDFCGEQSGYGEKYPHPTSVEAYFAAGNWTHTLYSLEPHKPVMDIEAWYDDGNTNTITHPGDAHDARAVGYISRLSGAKGYTYGSPLYYFSVNSSDPGYWRHILALQSSSEVGLLMRYLFEVLSPEPWTSLVPRPDALEHPLDATSLTRAVLSVGPAGGLLYFPSNSTQVTVSARTWSTKVTSTVWWNPVNNETACGPDLSAAVGPPPFAEDAVLVIWA